MKEWEFYSTSSKDMMTYVDDKKIQKMERLQIEKSRYNTITVPRDYHIKVPNFII